MNDELVVAVRVEAFQPGPVPPHAMHSWGGVSGKLDPFRVHGIELRMDHGAREVDEAGLAPVNRADDQAPAMFPLASRDEAITGGAQRAFA